MSEAMTTVYWYDHQCDWITNYCEQEHQRVAYIPTRVLRDYDDKKETAHG